jgi:16S rRNA (guanine527-N7)-methyltransferase
VGKNATVINAREFRSRLTRRARKAGLAIPADLAAQLWTYFELLVRWNRKINLTAFDEGAPDAAIDRLLIEPLQAARHLAVVETRAIMDVGSGGGSPAIPMKLAMEATTLVMVEPKARKSAFLREAVRLLSLRDTRVETARFEELLTRPELHEAQDVVTMRAVRIERKTLVGLQAFLRPGGRLLLFQGPPGAEAVPAVAPPPLAVESAHPLIANNSANRLIILRKSVPRGTIPVDEVR